jgi:hypothetical protein
MELGGTAAASAGAGAEEAVKARDLEIMRWFDQRLVTVLAGDDDAERAMELTREVMLAAMPRACHCVLLCMSLRFVSTNWACSAAGCARRQCMERLHRACVQPPPPVPTSGVRAEAVREPADRVRGGRDEARRRGSAARAAPAGLPGHCDAAAGRAAGPLAAPARGRGGQRGCRAGAGRGACGRRGGRGAPTSRRPAQGAAGGGLWGPIRPLQLG